MKAPIETVKAIVYRPRGESTRAKLRAKIIEGKYEDLRVSCPHSVRENWQPGQYITATGRIVCGDTQSAYFKATEITA